MTQFGRIVLLLFVTITVVTVLMVPKHTAYADPHATFFTAVGQRQLFFNMLAALDQADYVEPATNQGGLPPGYSREELLEKRTAAGFPREEDPVLRATETELSSILTRSVTLEGQDLWSAYMSFQFALEVDRRRNSVELINLLCERGLGIRKCEEGSENIKVARAREEHAYNKRPLDQLAAQQLAGTHALRYLLAPEYDQEERLNAMGGDSIDHNKNRAFNHSIAALADNTKNDPLKNQLAKGMANDALNINTANVNPNIYNHINVDNGGIFRFDDDTTTSEAIFNLGQLLGAPNQILGAKMQAINQKKIIDGEVYASGARADTFAVPNATNTDEGTRITSLNEQLHAPSYAKRAQLESTLDLITQLQSNSAYTSKTENIPGGTQLVRPTSSNGEGTQAFNSNSAQGQVASAHDGEDDDNPNTHPGGVEQDEKPTVPKDPQEALARNSDPVGFMEEVGPSNFFSNLIGGDRRGLNTSLNEVLGGYAAMILNDINS